jgi:hypothetical protein
MPAAGQPGHNGSCGTSGAISPADEPVKSCIDLMKKACPDTANRQSCERCAANVSAAVLKAANCTQYQTNTLWCHDHGRPPPFGLDYRPPFVHPISDVVAPCFTSNGSWDPSGKSASGLACGFTAVNGQVRHSFDAVAVVVVRLVQMLKTCGCNRQSAGMATTVVLPQFAAWGLCGL